MAEKEPHSVAPWETNLPERLRRARAHARVPAAEMAAILEVTERTIRNYETGATPIKNKDIRDWAMRCGGPPVLEWIKTGRVPVSTGPNGGPGQVTDMSGWTRKSRLQAA